MTAVIKIIDSETSIPDPIFTPTVIVIKLDRPANTEVFSDLMLFCCCSVYLILFCLLYAGWVKDLADGSGVSSLFKMGQVTLAEAWRHSHEFFPFPPEPFDYSPSRHSLYIFICLDLMSPTV